MHFWKHTFVFLKCPSGEWRNVVLCDYQLFLSGLDSLMGFPGWLGFTLGRLCSTHPLCGRSLVKVCLCLGDGKRVIVQVKLYIHYQLSFDTSVSISLAKAFHMTLLNVRQAGMFLLWVPWVW